MASLLLVNGLTVRPVLATVPSSLPSLATMHKNSFADLSPDQRHLFHYWYEASEDLMKAQQAQAKAAEKFRSAQNICKAAGFIPDEYLAYYLRGQAEIAG